jgi:hypothetical protein
MRDEMPRHHGWHYDVRQQVANLSNAHRSNERPAT